MKTTTSRPKSALAPPFDSEALLRGSGLRVTRAAQTVLELIEHSSQPLTHEEVAAAYTTATGEAPDRVTIYRVLDRLVEAGLCDRRVVADRINRFSRHVEAESGNIFECDQCHKVLALPSDPELPKVMGRLGRALRKQGIDTRRTALTLHGTCGNCARSQVQ
ncbi:Fur family transcriptional regulator [Variovorax sp. Root434]|uniref:Fur family transcriptional regulator n=1 Tax=Variovorax sp. Root434 TaxID=1736536 RepID=UPI0006F7A33F|nr:transcriptional repressor [Variovorax sp. Root434]KQX39752.1 Fe2+/Zn2+ uptake regulation protein [Variovorax sp. Root434]